MHIRPVETSNRSRCGEGISEIMLTKLMTIFSKREVMLQACIVLTHKHDDPHT